ncbi:MAG: ATP-dependent metallopeptidase FtsH/Yme1/Tma family protein, partial [Lachnospiraceae bacterium]|nr:ATP-dependent metallopeptidase FtsH/Yme1/Tma family protein [Lachnospiraceae bacterium]
MDNNLNQYDGNYNNGNNNGGRGPENQGGGPGSNGNDPKKQSLIILVVAALITLLSISMFMKFLTGSTNEEISYNEFINKIEEEEIESVLVESDRITIYPKQANRMNPFLYSYGSNTTYY